jgi:HNH endonuclease
MDPSKKMSENIYAHDHVSLEEKEYQLTCSACEITKPFIDMHYKMKWDGTCLGYMKFCKQCYSKEPEKDSKFPGIPINMYPNYRITSGGQVFNALGKRYLTGTVANGYTKVCLVRYDGVRMGVNVHQLMARHFIVNPDPENNKVVDHINGDRANNTIENLRWADYKMNNRNVKKVAGKSSEFIGVSWDSHKNKWRVDVTNNGLGKFVGNFTNQVEAARVHDKYILDHYPNCYYKTNHEKLDSLSEDELYKLSKAKGVGRNYAKYDEDFFELHETKPITCKADPNHNYMITPEGILINVKMGRIVRGSVKGGYHDFHIKGGGYDLHPQGHQLVALAYIPNPDPERFTEIDHIDRNKFNNHYTNLRWVTRAENSANTAPHKGRATKGIKETEDGKFTATYRGKKLGTFDTLREATNAWDEKALARCHTSWVHNKKE